MSTNSEQWTTPAPLDLRQDLITAEWLLRPEWDAEGKVPFVCTIKGERAAKAAAFIHRAVNGRDALIAAAQEARDYVSFIHTADAKNLVVTLNAALAKA